MLTQSPKKVAIIIGGLKCGTTSLFSYLSDHPQISPSFEKELHYFSDERNFSRGTDWYYSNWKISPEHLVALEASPTYTMLPFREQVVERISNITDTSFYFIYIMRHPISRIESHIRHKVYAKGLTQSQAERAKYDEANIAFSRYAFQLDAYVNRFGRDRLHLLTLENLKRNPISELTKICTFLELDPNFNFEGLDTVFNSKESFKLPPAIYKLRHSELLAPLVQTFPVKLRHQVRSLMTQDSTVKVSLSQADKDSFIESLKPDLIRLRDEYGIDIKEQWNLSFD